MLMRLWDLLAELTAHSLEQPPRMNDYTSGIGLNNTADEECDLEFQTRQKSLHLKLSLT